MALPARRTRPRTGIERGAPLRCPGHLTFVRSHACCVPGCQSERIEAAHVRDGTFAGMGQKPDDCWTVSLCHEHHAEQHQIGHARFDLKHGINSRMLALEFAAKSPAWQRFLAKRRAEG